MLRKILLAFVLCFSTLVSPVRAHEGMWIPALIKALNISDMQSMGLKLSAEDIYSVNKSSLKDAIVHFGGGCTAEVVSGQGLILTNHHCGFSQIQSHSSLEHDYLKDGFWAGSYAEELPNAGLTASFIVRIEDVTDKVTSGTEGKDGDARAAVIRANIEMLEAKVSEEEAHHEAEIKPFFYGNEYYMIVTKTYTDVRLVGAPPSSVGKYGGDTDNWMWPRHTGDFSVFRIYSGPDGEPAAYSEDNVPLKPKHFFPVNAKGTEPGDFTMVYGFPGRTQQFLPSTALSFITETMNPAAIQMRESSLSIIDKAMASSDQIRIQYAAKQARIANAWKKWIGENRGLDRLDAINKKRLLESQFESKINLNRNWKEEYSGVLENLKSHYAGGEKYISARSMLIEFFYMGPEVVRFASGFERLAENWEKLEEAGELQTEVDRLKKASAGFFKNYNADVDRQVLAVLYPQYIANLDQDLRPSLHATLKAKYGDDWSRYAADLHEKSMLTSEAKVMAMLDKFSKKTVKKLKADPAYMLSQAVLEAWREKAAAGYSAWDAQLEELMRDYVRGLMTVFPDKTYWPDANSTLRVAYGKVEGSEPRDGVVYRPYTTLDGVLAKYVPGDREFDLPTRLIELAKKRDFGPYADKNGDLVVCFTASNHTTGGNSGSPVLDGNGYLIGINFDRSWESTMSDLMYDPEYCRNIIVDIRYVLFIIDKYAGADRLIQEMKVVQ